MPVWAIVTIVVLLVVAVLAAAGYGAFQLWKRFEQRRVLALISRREALRMARNSFAEVLGYLATADDDALAVFANDADELHRRVLGDVASRATQVRDELDLMPVPERLLLATESLADASWFLGEEAGKVGAAQHAADVLAALSEIDLEPMNRAFADADADLERLRRVVQFEDTAVYGGGLYV